MKDGIAYALMNFYFLLTCFDKMLVGEISEKIIKKKNSNKSKKKPQNNQKHDKSHKKMKN